jgi:serine/threonine protein kinase
VAELAAKLHQFEILAFIGQGGMGAVFKACQKQLDRVVALKILPPGLGENPAFADRFVREAKAMARLSHPGIVAIHDFGHAEGLYFLVMEFVDGVNLRQLIQTDRMAPREALATVPQICDALQYAHDQGVVHRDIKPENILLDRRGRVKVADFGLAKLLSANGESGWAAPTGAGAPGLTEAGKVMGTPQYMAPEQAEGAAEVDHRTDIYALGVVFYQMLTGELPGRQIEPPSRKVQVDVRLDEVVLRALEREPARRYQQASQVKTAVETITQSSEAQPGSMAGTKLRPRLRSRILMGVGLALVVLLIGGALGYRHWVSGRDQAARSGASTVRHAQNWLANGLIAYYPFNGDANDASGHGYNGTAHNTTTVPDHLSNADSAYSLNGADAYIYFGPVLPDMPTMTVTAWVKSFGGGTFFADADWQLANDFTINLGGSDTVFRCDKSPAPSGLSHTIPLNTQINGVWRNIVWVVRTNLVQVYVDGDLKGFVDIEGAGNIGYHDFVIGTQEFPQGTMGWNGYWKGDVSNLRIYNRALSADEVRQLYAYESQMTAPLKK